MTAPSTQLDPITIEVVRHKLDGIANEMDAKQRLAHIDLGRGVCRPLYGIPVIQVFPDVVVDGGGHVRDNGRTFTGRAGAD